MKGCSQRKMGEDNRFERHQDKESLKEGIKWTHSSVLRWHPLLRVVWGQGPLNCANTAGMADDSG